MFSDAMVLIGLVLHAFRRRGVLSRRRRRRWRWQWPGRGPVLYLIATAVVLCRTGEIMLKLHHEVRERAILHRSGWHDDSRCTDGIVERPSRTWCTTRYLGRSLINSSPRASIHTRQSKYRRWAKLLFLDYQIARGLVIDTAILPLIYTLRELANCGCRGCRLPWWLDCWCGGD